MRDRAIIPFPETSSYTVSCSKTPYLEAPWPAPSPGCPACIRSAARSKPPSARTGDGRISSRLFELQPRAAQKLLELLPTVQVGTSRLVEREALAAFLEGVAKAGNTAAYLAAVRRDRAAVSRRKLRHLVARDREPVRLVSLPETLHLERGRLEVTFTTIEELAQNLYALAQAIETDGDVMAGDFELLPPRPSPPEDEEVAVIFAELEQLERAYRERQRRK